MLTLFLADHSLAILVEPVVGFPMVVCSNVRCATPHPQAEALLHEGIEDESIYPTLKQDIQSLVDQAKQVRAE